MELYSHDNLLLKEARKTLENMSGTRVGALVNIA